MSYFKPQLVHAVVTEGRIVAFCTGADRGAFIDITPATSDRKEVFRQETTQASNMWTFTGLSTFNTNTRLDLHKGAGL